MWAEAATETGAQLFFICGQQLSVTDHRFAQAVTAAHQRRERPRCLCVPDGAPMYVARLDGGYIVKRMPETGHQHAPGCPHYEPPADEAGLSHVMGTAIQEDPDTGLTTLKLDFALNRLGPRGVSAGTVSSDDSTCRQGTRLSLGGLLRYLWHEAQLDRWHPAFEGKRNWGTVRRRLLQAARHKMTHSGPLVDRLYIPEPFYVEQRDSINLRRIKCWRQALTGPGEPRALMLLIGELKEIVPLGNEYRVVVKHVPDQGFLLNEPLHRVVARRLANESAKSGEIDQSHILVIASFSNNTAGIPALDEAALQIATANWTLVNSDR